MDLPGDLKSSVTGGSRLWEEAQIAWHLRESLPEFQDRDPEEQHWLVATWRTTAKIAAIEALERWQESKRK